MNNDKIDLVHRRKSEPGKWKHQWAKKNTRIEIKFQFPLRSSVSLNLAGFYWKNVCLEYWPLWHSHYTLTLTVTAGPLPVIRKYLALNLGENFYCVKKVVFLFFISYSFSKCFTCVSSLLVHVTPWLHGHVSNKEYPPWE